MCCYVQISRTAKLRYSARQTVTLSFWLSAKYSFIHKYPTPAVRNKATAETEEIIQSASGTPRHISTFVESSGEQRLRNPQPAAGTLPASANGLSNAARGLLMRLLDRDPRVRMRNLRQLQQSAFYMGFNFEAVKTKKVSPKPLLDKHFAAMESPEDAENLRTASQNVFASFDQSTLI